MFGSLICRFLFATAILGYLAESDMIGKHYESEVGDLDSADTLKISELNSNFPFMQESPIELDDEKESMSVYNFVENNDESEQPNESDIESEEIESDREEGDAEPMETTSATENILEKIGAKENNVLNSVPDTLSGRYLRHSAHESAKTEKTGNRTRVERDYDQHIESGDQVGNSVKVDETKHFERIRVEERNGDDGLRAATENVPIPAAISTSTKKPSTSERTTARKSSTPKATSAAVTSTRASTTEPTSTTEPEDFTPPILTQVFPIITTTKASTPSSISTTEPTTPSTRTPSTSTEAATTVEATSHSSPASASHAASSSSAISSATASSPSHGASSSSATSRSTTTNSSPTAASSRRSTQTSTPSTTPQPTTASTTTTQPTTVSTISTTNNTVQSTTTETSPPPLPEPAAQVEAEGSAPLFHIIMWVGVVGAATSAIALLLVYNGILFGSGTASAPAPNEIF